MARYVGPGLGEPFPDDSLDVNGMVDVPDQIHDEAVRAMAQARISWADEEVRDIVRRWSKGEVSDPLVDDECPDCRH